jgi:hypothetical protein
MKLGVSLTLLLVKLVRAVSTMIDSSWAMMLSLLLSLRDGRASQRRRVSSN